MGVFEVEKNDSSLLWQESSRASLLLFVKLTPIMSAIY